MNSLKRFKRLIIEGKQSQPENNTENKVPQNSKIPEIRQSAYKILNRKKRTCENKSQHSIEKKEPIKLMSTDNNYSPCTGDRIPFAQIINNTDNSKTNPLCAARGTNLKLLQLTEQELQCLQNIITIQKRAHQKRLRQSKSLSNLYNKVQNLKKNSQTKQNSKNLSSNYRRNQHNSEYQSNVLQIASFQEFDKQEVNDLSNSTLQKIRSPQQQWTQNSVSQKGDLQFKKIMYILQEKSRVMQNMASSKIQKKQQENNSYRFVEQIPIPSVSFRGVPQHPRKKAELIQIVSMLNTKYNKNIQFN